jgi:hypothetical protein
LPQRRGLAVVSPPTPRKWPQASIPIVDKDGKPTPAYLEFLAEQEAWTKAIHAAVAAL